jgi:S1-C subfamily serine protease
MIYEFAPADGRRACVRGLVAGLLMALAAQPVCGSTFPPPGDLSSAAAETCDSPSRVAAWPSWLSGRTPRRDTSVYPKSPHPAVARIIVPEDGATAYGSGTLVDVRDQYGLVVTNWHVVRDSEGVVEVVFPGGFRSQARPLKVDSDWDLAALVIWRPQIEPVRLADRAPRPGDPLTIHGYGKGQYRIATGRCTTYYAPKINFPHEMVELDVQARQGDSGGPIFNDRGQLAGVLFGAGQGTTIGAFAPRVETFLATLAPDIGQAKNATQVAVADRPAPNVHPLDRPAALDGVVRAIPAGYPSEKANASSANGFTANASGPAPQSDGWSSQAADVQLAGVATGEAITWREVADSDWFEFLKSALAFIGLVAVAVQLVRVVR